MKLFSILRRFARPTALLLCAVMAFMCIGCELSDVKDAIDVAGDVLELLDEATKTDSDAFTGGGDDSAQLGSQPSQAPPTDTTEKPIDENGKYYSKDDVALYIHTYSKLPSNFITKKEAESLGWEGGSVEKYAKGCAIGGDTFGNYEGLLPRKNGRVYKECDIDTLGASSRGAKRIVFSNDGLIYYTDDHYESFTLLYGEE